VQGHGIGDGAVAIEKIGVVWAGRESKFHCETQLLFIDEGLFYGRQRKTGENERDVGLRLSPVDCDEL
jgi:hypothetical protein